MRRTFKDIFSYLEGNFKFYMDKFDLTEDHIKEQVVWRLLICKEDCVKQNACVYCECPPEKKAFVFKSCNGGDRFPNLMGKDEWEKYKEEKKIQLDEQGI